MHERIEAEIEGQRTEAVTLEDPKAYFDKRSFKAISWNGGMEIGISTAAHQLLDFIGNAII